MSLSNLSNELLDAIIVFINDVEDLSSLSQTSRRHHAVTADHLHWRCRAASQDDQDTFSTLAINRRLASHVQRMELIDLGSRVTQGYYRRAGNDSGAEGKDRATELETAARNLVQLTSLDVRMWCSLVSLSSFFAGLSGSLRPLPALSVSVKDIDLDHLTTEIDVIRLMGNFTRFHWRSDDSFDSPILYALMDMLRDRCPALEELHIDLQRLMNPFGFPVSCPEFWDCRWPRLRVLQVNNIILPLRFEHFINEHPMIETISLTSGRVPLISFSPKALPLLREITTSFTESTDPGALLTLIKPLPDGTRRPIIRLSFISPAIFRDDRNLLKEFCEHLADLRSLKVLGWDDPRANWIYRLAEVAKVAHTVTTLLLKIATYNLPRGYARNTPDLATTLSEFSSLTEVQFMYDDLQQKAPFVRSLGARCPKLRRINNWSKGDDKEWNLVVDRIH